MDTASISGGSSSSKVGKLLPKKLTAKRRWKKQPSKESLGSTASSEDQTRGRSPHSRNLQDSNGSLPTLSHSHETDSTDGNGDDGETAGPRRDHESDNLP